MPFNSFIYIGEGNENVRKVAGKGRQNESKEKILSELQCAPETLAWKESER